VRFCVIRDNDGADCLALKRRLAALCAEAGRPEINRLAHEDRKPRVVQQGVLEL
jgi:hypothetical protein